MRHRVARRGGPDYRRFTLPRRAADEIAQIAPLAESCPPRLYGGTERIVSYLTEELTAQGHEVTLFASGDSKTNAELVRCSNRALRLNPKVKDHIPYHFIMLDEVRRRADEFDVLHFHIDLWYFPLVRDIAGRTVTTLHGRLDSPDLKPFYAAFPDIPLFRFPIISANRCRVRATGLVTFLTDCHAIFFRSILTRRAAILLSSVAFRQRSDRTARSTSLFAQECR